MRATSYVNTRTHMYSCVCITCVHAYVYAYIHMFMHTHLVIVMYLASNTATDLHINCKSVQKFLHSN